MKLIIDIPEDIYNKIMNIDKDYIKRRWSIIEPCIYSIRGGTPLPKRHGALIDRSKLLVELECGIRAGNYEEGYEKYPHINDMDDCFDTVKYADIIIEADKGE